MTSLNSVDARWAGSSRKGLALHRCDLDAPPGGASADPRHAARASASRDPEGRARRPSRTNSRAACASASMLASVMLLKPALLLADEPTTALDAVVQRDVHGADGRSHPRAQHRRAADQRTISAMVARYSQPHRSVMQQGNVGRAGARTEEHPRQTAAPPTRASCSPPCRCARRCAPPTPHRGADGRGARPRRGLPRPPAPVLRAPARRSARSTASTLQVRPREGGRGGGRLGLGQDHAGPRHRRPAGAQPSGSLNLFRGQPVDRNARGLAGLSR